MLVRSDSNDVPSQQTEYRRKRNAIEYFKLQMGFELSMETISI